MRAYFVGLSLAAALGLGLGLGPAADVARADPPEGDRTYQPLRSQKSFSIQRYPGDQAFAGGTVRMHGPDQGPYIERCTWVMDSTKPGFGLTQRCYRHTLENTPALQ